MAEFKEIQIGENGQVFQVKDETARNNAGGYTPPAGGIPKTDLAPSVQQALDDVANKVDKVDGKGLSKNDYTDADKAKVDSLKTVATSGSYNDLTDKPVIPEGATPDQSLDPNSDNAVSNAAVCDGLSTKANDNAVVKSISVNGTAQPKDGNGNVNIQVQAGGESIVFDTEGTPIIDSPLSPNADTVLGAASARWVKEIDNNVKAILAALAGIAFTGTKPTWQTVAKRKYNLTMTALTGCTGEVVSGDAGNGQVYEGGVRIKLTPTQASYAFTSVTVNGESASTTATGDADGSVYLDIVVNGNVTVAATAISGRGIDFTGSTGCSIGAAGVAIGQDLDTTITANEHFTLPASITVKIGNTNVAHTYTRAQDNKTATLHIDAANITGDLTITCTAVEDAHVTIAISGSNFVVKQGSTQLSNGSKVYNGSAAQTLTIEPASGYKFSTQPSADKGTMTNNGPYEASSLEIGTSVSGTLTITAAGAALETFSIDLSGVTSDVGVTWNTPATAVSTILEGSPFSVTLAKVGGTGVLNIGTCTMENGTLQPSSGTIATDHVTGDITIAASVAASRDKVHSYSYPSTSDSLGDCLVDTKGGFNLYKYNSTTASTFTNGGSGNNGNAAFQDGWFGNGKSSFLRKSNSTGTIEVEDDHDFTLIFKGWKLSISGNSVYTNSQNKYPFFDEADESRINEATNSSKRFAIWMRTYDASATLLGGGRPGFPAIKYIDRGEKAKVFAASNSNSLGCFLDMSTLAHDVIISYNASTKKATAWVAKEISGNKVLKLTGTIDVAALSIQCIQMPSSSTYIQGLDIYNYAMTEQEAAIATNSVIS